MTSPGISPGLSSGFKKDNGNNNDNNNTKDSEGVAGASVAAAMKARVPPEYLGGGFAVSYSSGQGQCI